MKYLISIFSLALLTQVAAAQSYMGTYTGTAAGQPITLSIQQDAQGNVSGTFLAADGRQYQLQGVPADQGAISGRMADAQGQASFGAALDGEMLVLYIIPWQADGQPDYNAGQELVLQRQGGSAPTGPGAAGPGSTMPSPGFGGEPGGGASTGLSGTYSGSVQGTPVTLTLAQQGTGLQGELVDNTGYRYTLSGTVQGSAGSGTLSDPQTGGTMQFEVAAQGNGLALTLIVQDPNTGQMNRIPLQFQRGGAAPSQPPAGGMSGGMSGAPGAGAQANVQRDPQLVGTWSKSESTTSGSYSMASQVLMHVHPDGTVQYGGGRVMVGGSSPGGQAWGDTGQGNDYTTVQWRTENSIIYLAQPGSNQWVPAARYYIEGNKMLLYLNDGSRELWYRQ